MASMSASLADRIRELVRDEPGVTEKRMFGGLCFLLNGNMLVSARRDGSLLARLGEKQADSDVRTSGVNRMVMRGREMKDYVIVAADQFGGDRLQDWIAKARDHVGKLPPKA